MKLQHYLMPIVLLFSSSAFAEELSDDEVTKRIIAESIASYSGNCPCPYNRTSNGSKCGKRSAWSKPGGASPICYRSDVTDVMIKRWREKQ